MIVFVFLAIKAFQKQDTKKILTRLLAIPAYLVVMFIVMMGYQGIYVKQNELDKQKALLQLMTRLAEAKVSVREEGTISADDLERELGL